MNASVTVFTDLRLSDVGFLLEATLRTLGISIVAIVVGSLLGIGFGWALHVSKRFGRWVLMPVLDVFRSVPLLIQLILFNSFVAIAGYPLSPFWAGTIVLAVYTSALVAWVALAGIEAVSKDLTRASRSLGLSYRQTMAHIVWPVGLRTVFPSWVGVALSVIKDSALVSAIGYIELLRASQILTTRTQESFKIMLIVGALYFLLSFPLARLAARLEKRWNAA